MQDSIFSRVLKERSHASIFSPLGTTHRRSLGTSCMEGGIPSLTSHSNMNDQGMTH